MHPIRKISIGCEIQGNSRELAVLIWSMAKLSELAIQVNLCYLPASHFSRIWHQIHLNCCCLKSSNSHFLAAHFLAANLDFTSFLSWLSWGCIKIHGKVSCSQVQPVLAHNKQVCIYRNQCFYASIANSMISEQKLTIFAL